MSLFLTMSAPMAFSQGAYNTLSGSLAKPLQLSPQVATYTQPMQLAHPAPLSAASSEGHPIREAGGSRPPSCARLRDGRYFPLSRNSAISPAEQCRSFCPTAKTKIFSGSAIANAIAPDGTRYASLENAFVYRKRIVQNCTCNGRDAFGLAGME